MDSIRASEAPDSGSIPDEATIDFDIHLRNLLCNYCHTSFPLLITSLHQQKK